MESPDRSTSVLESAKKRKMLGQSDNDLQTAIQGTKFALSESPGIEDSYQVESMSKDPERPELPGIAGVSEGDNEATQAKADAGTMEGIIQQVRQKMDHFTLQVSGLLEAGKSYFHMAANEFEEKIVQLHQAQIEKWESEIQSVVGMHFENEEMSYRLNNAQAILGIVHTTTP